MTHASLSGNSSTTVGCTGKSVQKREMGTGGKRKERRWEGKYCKRRKSGIIVKLTMTTWNKIQ